MPSIKIPRALSDVLTVLLPFALLRWFVPGLGPLSLGNDYRLFAFHQQLELQYALVHGTFPLFCAGFLEGNTCAALTLGQLYHPLPYLSRLIPGYWQGHALDWNTLLRLLELGLTQALLRRYFLRLKLGPLAAFIASFIAVYNLRMIDMFRYGASLENYTAFVALCASLGLYYLDQKSRVLPVLIVVTSYLLIVGGHPQIMYLGLLGAAVVGLLLPWLTEALDPTTARPTGASGRRALLRFYALCALFVLCGTALSAPYLLSFNAEVVGNNVSRVGRAYAWSTQYTDTWGGGINSFFRPLHADVHGAFGASAMTLVAPLLPFARRNPLRVHPGAWALWAVALLTFLVSLGPATPLHRLFWQFVPLANSFRVPGRVALSLPLLCAFAFAYVLRPDHEETDARGAPLRVGILGAALLVVFNGWVSRHLPAPSNFNPERIGALPPWVELVTLCLGVMALLAFAFIRDRSLRAQRFAAVALCVAVMGQTSLALRYGTWWIPRAPSATLEKIELSRRTDIGFNGTAGVGMEAASVQRQMTRSILDPELARFYRSYEAVTSNEEAYRAMAQRSPQSIVVEEPHARMVQGSAASDPDRVALQWNSFNRYRFIVRCHADGYFTVAFPFSDHFGATVDGHPTPMRRANGYEIAIPLTAGTRVVELKYRSQATEAGLLLAAATLALLLSALALVHLKGRALRAAAIAASALLAVGLARTMLSRVEAGDNLGTRYGWDSTQLPSRDNLAFGRVTTMSSQEMAFQANAFYSGRGVDGSVRGPGFATQRRDAHPWWQVDLGGVHRLATLRYYTDDRALGTLQNPLLVRLVSGGPVDDLLRVTDRAELSSGVYSVPLEGASARAVRLQLPTRGMLSLREVELFEAR